MITNLEFGEKYKLFLSELYGGTKINAVIIGETTIDNVTKNKSGYNIYETYFEPVGLGLTSYYTAIRPNSRIMICSKIKSFYPYTLDTDKIFIPYTLIDLKNSSKYIKSTNITININPVVKYFNDDNERNTFIDNLTERTKTLLNTSIEYANLDSEVTATYEDLYILDEDLEALNEKRISAYTKYKNRLLLIESEKDLKNLSYVKKISEYENSILSYNKKAAEYAKMIEDLQDELKFYQDWHSTIEDITPTISTTAIETESIEDSEIIIEEEEEKE